LHYRTVPADGQRRRDVADSALGLNPVHETGRARQPECQKQRCDRHHHDHFEESEALGHPLFIRVGETLPAPEKPGEKPENAPFAG